MNSLDQYAASRLAELDRDNTRRALVTTARLDGAWVERDGRRLLSFCCNDYLNLSRHPDVIAASIAATRAHGTGAGASRLVTGNHPVLVALEARLAALKGTQAACVFGSGYLANIGIIPALVGRGDLVVIDALAHACQWSGARLAGATIQSFTHNDVADLDTILGERRAHHARVLVLTESVFSMDGDRAPVDALATVCAAHDAWLMTDDAHGLGVLGEPGNGHGHAEVPLQMGTLSKALGSYGGYVCGSAALVAMLRNRARSFVYATGLPPGCAAAALAALDVIAADPDYAARPLIQARTFTALAGLPEAQSPIVPLILGEAAVALAASAHLADHGFLVAAIRPPTVPPGTARLRFTFTAQHPDEAVTRLAALVRAL